MPEISSLYEARQHLKMTKEQSSSSFKPTVFHGDNQRGASVASTR
jgi:hypothetical protein